MQLRVSGSLALACLLGCAASSVRYPPAIATPTAAFPQTWDEPQPPPNPVDSPRAHSTNQAPPPSALAASIGASPLIAVLEFRDRLQGDDRNGLDANYLSNAVRASVKRTLPDSRLMTQENIQVLLASAHKSLEDCQGQCEVDTGRLLGADVIITGDMLRVGTKLKLDLRMHETKTGQLVSGSTASGASVDELDSDLPRAVKELTDGLH